MKTIHYIIAIVLAVILAYVFYTAGVDSVGVISHSDTLRFYSDTGKHIVNVDKPYPVIRDTGSTEYILVPVDSSQIFEAYAALHKLYYTRNIYMDTLKNDSAAFIALGDTVFKNELQQRKLIYQNKTPIYYITKTLTIPEKSKLYIGADVTGLSGTVGFDASIIFINKGVAYRYTYSPLVGEHSLGVSVSLWPRSRSPAK